MKNISKNKNPYLANFYLNIYTLFVLFLVLMKSYKDQFLLGTLFNKQLKINQLSLIKCTKFNGDNILNAALHFRINQSITYSKIFSIFSDVEPVRFLIVSSKEIILKKEPSGNKTKSIECICIN